MGGFEGMSLEASVIEDNASNKRWSFMIFRFGGMFRSLNFYDLSVLSL